MHEINMFGRSGALSLDGFEGSGADWLERYKPYIEDGRTIVASPLKVYGPENSDIVLQLRKRGIEKIVLAGMSANLCVEAHLRELLEQGFEVAVVKDATAGARHPELGDGYKAARVNFGYLASAVLTTDEAVRALSQGLSAAAWLLRRGHGQAEQWCRAGTAELSGATPPSGSNAASDM